MQLPKPTDDLSEEELQAYRDPENIFRELNTPLALIQSQIFVVKRMIEANEFSAGLQPILEKIEAIEHQNDYMVQLCDLWYRANRDEPDDE